MAAYVCSLCQALFDATPGTERNVRMQCEWIAGFCLYFSLPDKPYCSAPEYSKQLFFNGSKALPRYLINACCELDPNEKGGFFDRIPIDADLAAQYGRTFEDFLRNYVALADAERRCRVIATLRAGGAEFSDEKLSIEAFAKEFSIQFVEAVANNRQTTEHAPQSRQPSYLQRLADAADKMDAKDIEPKYLPRLKGVLETKNCSSVQMLYHQLFNDGFVLLHAEGGAGKSKLLKKFAVYCFSSLRAHGEDEVRIPLYYPLADLNGRTNIDQKMLIDYVAHYYLDDEDSRQLREAFEKHRFYFILLLDGLNEITLPAHQEWLIRQLEWLARNVSDQKIQAVVTCRTRSMTTLYEQDSSLFTVYQLELTDAQKLAFFKNKGKEMQGEAFHRNTELWNALTPLYLRLCLKLPTNADQPTTVTQLLYNRYHNQGVDGMEKSRKLSARTQALQRLSLYLLLPALCDQLQREHKLTLGQTELFDRIGRLYQFVSESDSVRGLMPRLPVNIASSTDEIVRYLVEDALLEVDMSGRYTIHEQRRDYFAAYHQRNLCKLALETTNEETWQETARKALASGVPFYVDIAQRREDTQALFAMILRCENPEQFANPRSVMDAIGSRLEKLQEVRSSSLRTERLEELRAFVVSVQDYAHFAAPWEDALHGEMHKCLAALCKSTDQWTSDWSAQYQTRMMIENCEYIRYLRENERLDQAMRHTIALYRHVVENRSRIEKLSSNPLMFGFLNQAGKCVLRQIENLSQKIEINGKITRETFDMLKNVVALENAAGSEKTVEALRETIMGQIEPDKAYDDLDTQYALARNLLMLSAYHSSAESLNLLGMMYEQQDVWDETVDAEQRKSYIQQAFLFYYCSSRIPHPRVQTYAIQKVVELCLKEGIRIGGELPETLADIVKQASYFTEGELKDCAPTRRLVKDYLLVMENCGMPSAKALNGLFAALLSQKEALGYLEEACAAPSPPLDVLLLYLQLLPERSHGRANELQSLQEKCMEAIGKLAERRNGVKRADRWCPSTYELARMRATLDSAPYAGIWRCIKNEFDRQFPTNTLVTTKR